MERHAWFFWVSLGMMLSGWFWLHIGSCPVIDEEVHAPQIQAFAAGDFRWRDDLAMTPGYHAAMAVLARVTGLRSLEGLRVLSFATGLLRLVFFYYLVRRFWPQERFLRSLQFAFFPVVFPYCFLVYNDLWTVWLVLLALLLVEMQRRGSSAVALAAAVAVRQTTLFWGGLLAILAAGDSFPPRNGADWRRFATRTWPFAMVLAAFGVFVWWNGGVAIGARDLTPVTFNPTNVWAFLFVFVLLFLPDALLGVRECVRRGGRTLLYGVVVTAMLWVIFVASYNLPHIFNRMNLAYVLHNIVLNAIPTTPWVRVMALAVIPFGLAGMIFTPLVEDRFRWWIPMALLSVLWVPYIDPRYCVVPLTLFLLLRRPLSRRIEIGMTLYYITAAVVLNEVSFRFIYFP